MKRLSSLKKWAVRLAVAAFVAAALSGCGSSVAGVGSGGTGPVASSTLPRNVDPQVSDADLAAVVAGNTTFALNVFPQLDTNANDNTFFSPYSITMAFAMLAPGANGTSLSQIEQAMSFTLPQDRLNPAFDKLDLLLSSEATGKVVDGVHMPILKNANAVWAQKGMSFLQTYLDTLAVNYGAGVHIVDFANTIAASDINKWVAQQTDNKIQNLIPQGGLSSATRMVLTNALWFKAGWAYPFPTNSTANNLFTNRDGSSSSVPFMTNDLGVPYAQADGCQAIDIPYAENNLSMLILMPTPGTFDQFAASLTPAVLADITTQAAANDGKYYIAFSMPKFTFTQSADIGPLLQSLGMTDPFDPNLADFSGIDGLHDLYVQNVYHQAYISVDEQGTEAAAATAIVIPPTGIITPNLTLAIDHPFIFLIRDRQTGLILFMGKVVKLSAS